MKGLTTEMKEQVRSALIAYRSNYPTLNRAAESLQGVKLGHRKPALQREV